MFLDPKDPLKKKKLLYICMHACFYACITLLLYIVFVLYVCCVALYCQNMFGCLFVLLLYTVTVNLYIHVGLLKIANVNVLLLNTAYVHVCCAALLSTFCFQRLP